MKRAEQSENICAESISWIRVCREFLELKERYHNFICEFFTYRTLQNKHPSALCIKLCQCDVSSFSSFFLSELFFPELKRDITTHLSDEGGSGSVLLDIQVPVSDGSKEFMGKLSFRRRRASQPAQGEDRNSTAREDLVRARAVLKAISWIEDVLSKGAVRGSMVYCVPALL